MTAALYPSRADAIRESLLRHASIRAVLIRQATVQRVNLLEAVHEDEDARLAVIEQARRDPVWFINQFVYTLDPRNVAEGLPGDIPLTLRPKQVEYVRWLDDRVQQRQNGLTEKSRDEGMTWVICAYYVHHWLFWKDFQGGIGSRKEMQIDRLGDMNSIFEKIRFILDRLPPWLKPKGYQRKKHAAFMKIINPVNGNAITGEAGDNIGRGGRSTIYFVDEHAALERPESVDSALSGNTNTVIYGSTPKGVGNLFFKKRFSGKIAVFTFHWRDNPDKNYTAKYLDPDGDLQTIHPWYEWAVDRIDDPVIIAQEIDIDYTASVQGIVIPAKWVQAALHLELSPDGLTQAGLDVSAEGEDKTVLARRAGPVLLSVQPMEGDSIEDDVREEATRAGVMALLYDRTGVGAGITRTLNRDKAVLPFHIEGVANGAKASGREYPDRPELTARQRFANFAAECWWRLRLRFQATFKRVVKGEDIPDDECISLSHLKGDPNLQKIIAQLSQPTFKKTGTSDKIVVNKYGEGSISPDFAEAIMYAFAPFEVGGEVTAQGSVVVPATA